MGIVDHAWLPKTRCGQSCVSAGLGESENSVLEGIRILRRLASALVVFPTLLLLAIPLPGRIVLQRRYCRLMLRCLGVRIALTGDPVRNLSGVLVVSNHVSWVDVFVIGAVLPGSFVAKSEMVDWPGLVHHRPCRGPVVAAAGYRPSRTGCPPRGRRAWRRIAVGAGDAFRLRWRPCAGGVSAVGSDGARRLL